MSHEAQTFDSVEKMVEGLWGQDAFAETVKQRIAQRRIVSTLQAMRVARNIPQSRIAEALQCTQSRVSKIENCDDAELTLKELEAYARVFDCDLNLLFSSRKMTAVDRVKYHAFAIKRELEQMADSAQGDHQIARGVADFYREAFINFIKMIQEAASQLPNQPENGALDRVFWPSWVHQRWKSGVPGLAFPAWSDGNAIVAVNDAVLICPFPPRGSRRKPFAMRAVEQKREQVGQVSLFWFEAPQPSDQP